MKRFYRDDETGELHHISQAISPDDGPLLTAPSSAPDSEWFKASAAAVRVTSQSPEKAALTVSGRADITTVDCGLCLHALTFTCPSVGLPCERVYPTTAEVDHG